MKTTEIKTDNTVATPTTVTVASLIDQAASAAPSTTASDPKQLKIGAVLHRETVDLGMGLGAAVQIYYSGYGDTQPETGAEWTDSRDYPSATLKITLPKDSANHLTGHLRCASVVLGEILGSDWGDSDLSKTARVWDASLAAAVRSLKEQAATELGDLRTHVAARAARIAKRIATHAAGLDIS